MYTAEFVKNSLSQLRFIQIEVNKLAFETAKAVKSILTKSELNNLRFIRFNVNGELLDDYQLEKLNIFAGILKKELGIKIAYSYTHNRMLDLSKASEIVFNSSFEDKSNQKNCLIKFGWNPDLMQDKSIIVCNGDCNRCSYCKNPLESRTVIFLTHGGKYKGVKEIPEQYMDILNKEKEDDYVEFCKKFDIEY